MRILGIVTKWLFILSLPALLISATIAFEFNSIWLYKDGFEKYHISQTTGLAQSELDKAANRLICYFNSDEEYINLTVVKDGQPFILFNEREVAHLRDVKGLIRLDYTVLLWTFVYSLVYTMIALFWQKRRHWRRLAWGLVGGSGITLALMLALGLGTLFGFDQLFLRFHLISFANELWLLDPTRDYLIMLFPRGFWFDAMLFITLATVVGAVVLGGVAGGYLRFNKTGAS